eukprot:Amastigsp_a1205_164.p2 type:complete len:105 gc:universal Amastigsp_a1205_164:297-611(+)
MACACAADETVATLHVPLETIGNDQARQRRVVQPVDGAQVIAAPRSKHEAKTRASFQMSRATCCLRVLHRTGGGRRSLGWAGFRSFMPTSFQRPRGSKQPVRRQ